MQAEDFSAIVERKRLDILQCRLMSGIIKDAIHCIFGHFEAILDDFFRIETFKNDFNEPSIHGICDSASIVCLGCHVIQCLIGNVLILVQKHLQLQLRNRKICSSKLIGYVPA